ncbi:alpha/beta hydrolase [Mycoplasma miroungirhinis]|uniref:Alpha/beta fold hydrolase n=1 Tax=Mycoplasma miroungirhinis TaxID=754516 RepID=A0A6M4JE04_9MOLU|nr:alpha/beta fold hydrolase [Mycoplasma miroungirhinis]QJR44317.1 alpha/beta fold hydrolase [Mycoplasma miroungirhinis]
MENKNFIHLLGEKIHVYLENTNNKNKVLLLHGFNSSFNIYQKLINEKDRNFDIATFDFPGCGLSSNNNKIDLNLYKLITIEFIKKYNLQNCVIVSHSLGAISALEAIKNNFAQFAILSNPFHPFLNIKSFMIKHHTTKQIIKYHKEIMHTQLKENLIKKWNFAKNLFNASKFTYLFKNQMVNTNYIETYIKPLYFITNKYEIVAGTIDIVIPLSSCKKLAKQTNKNLWTFKYPHKLWQNVSDMDLQILIELIERQFSA